MARRSGKPVVRLVELGVMAGLISLAVLATAILLPPITRPGIESFATMQCRSYLRSIGGAVTLYKSENGDRWPWIHGVTSDWSAVPTGTNRDKDPNDDPNGPGDRSITSLLFLLVREGMPAKWFICPSDANATRDPNVPEPSTRTAEWDDAWDFSHHTNVSYSWQAPVQTDHAYTNGLDEAYPATAILADKTPAYTDPAWRPDTIGPAVDADLVRRNISRNHAHGGQINVLTVGMAVMSTTRPDVGDANDNIYTASGTSEGGSRGATSLGWWIIFRRATAF